jgi:hypothetical protein
MKKIINGIKVKEKVWKEINSLRGEKLIIPTIEKIRKFETGATRDTDEGKLDFEGFLSPLVLERYAQYMNKHRLQSDGQLRDSDNWQKGIPVTQYMKSMWRHFFAVWKGHRQGVVNQDDICGVLFNAMGMLHELLKEK